MRKNNLIKNYMQNNKLNIEEVMKDYTAYLYTIVKNKNSNLPDEDREEIISDVFLAVWKNQRNLDWNKEMSSYLVGITRNVYHKKTRSLRNTLDITDYENCFYQIEDIETEIEISQSNQIMMEEIKQMKEEDKVIFMSYYYQSKSIKEIACQLKISETKVKSRLFRIRRKLKKTLEKRGYSYDGK